MRLIILVFVVLFASMSLTGCGGSSTKSAEPEKGSLMRTFKLVDEQGRESGSLILNPQGGAELRDNDGKVIGSFTPEQEAKTPEAKPVEEEPTADKEDADSSGKDMDDDLDDNKDSDAKE